MPSHFENGILKPMKHYDFPAKTEPINSSLFTEQNPMLDIAC